MASLERWGSARGADGRLPLSLKLLIVAIPWAVPAAIDVSGTVSFSILHVVLLGLLSGNAIRLLAGETLTRGGRTEMFLLALILALGLLNLAYSLDVPRGVAHWVLSAFLLAGFWAVRSRVESPLQVIRLVDWVIVSSLPVLAYGIIQTTQPESALPRWSTHAVVYLGSKPFLRAFSTFENSLYFALYTNLVFSLSMARLVGGREWGARVLALVGAVVSLLALFRTASVGALAGALAGGAFALAVGRPARLLFLPAGAAAALLAMPEAFRLKLLGVAGGFTSSLPARLVLYRASIGLIRENPILGVGLGSVEEAIRRGDRLSYSPSVAFTSENFILERGVESGIPGLLLYAALLAVGFAQAARGWRDGTRDGDPARREAARATLAFLVGFCAQCLTIAVGNFSHMALLGVFLASASVVGQAPSASQEAAEASNPRAAGR